MIYLQLFLAFLQIGAFSFGGGYAAMPLIQAQVVDHFNWLSPADFADLVTIAEMTPGPIAVNAATFVGNQIGGISGALAATAGVILPSSIFVTCLAWLYKKYGRLDLMQGILKSLRPAVIAMILTAGISILIPTLFPNGNVSLTNGNPDIPAMILFIAAFAVLRLRKINPIIVMLICGAAELGFQML